MVNYYRLQIYEYELYIEMLEKCYIRAKELGELDCAENYASDIAYATKKLQEYKDKLEDYLYNA